MASDSNNKVRHQLDFTIYHLPSTLVRIDFPTESGAEHMMLTAMPTVRIGSGYVESPIVVSNLFVQPRRIQFEISNPPPLLPVSVQLSCAGSFVFGWLQVPEAVQTSIATVAQGIRIVGPGYWALPLGDGIAVPAALPAPAPRPAGAKPEAGKAEKTEASKPAEGETRTLDAVVRTARAGQPAPAAARATTGSSRESTATPA